MAAGAVGEVGRRVGTSLEGDPGAGSPRVAIVCSKFNGGITLRLLAGALAGLAEHGVDLATTTVAWVPGAFEVPIAAQRCAGSGDFDAVVTLGAVIRGDTAHFDFVAGECAAGVQRVALDARVPVVFGVLTIDTVEQALERSLDDATNKGREAVVTALEMVDVLARIEHPIP